MAKKVVLAYSGGLDTSVAIPWMAEHWGVEVVALLVDVGQGGDHEAARRRARAAGAIDAMVVDARDELARDVVARAIAANALYEGRYPLVSALSRPVIVRHLVAAAKRHGADAVAHGCTGKGNDQVRFEVGTKALDPSLEVLAPVREWGLTREDCIAYAESHGLELSVSRERPYSIDANLWGRAIECGVIEDPWASPPEDVFSLSAPRGDVTATEEVSIGFEGGVPVSLDGESLGLVELIGRLNEIVGRHGLGRIDMVENRRVGIKSREVYEAPAALALLAAHRDLEGLTLERDVAHEKARLEPRWAELVYDGLWFSPLREAIDAFVATTQTAVTGEVRVAVGPRGLEIVGRRSDFGLYDEGLATYGREDHFDQSLAPGFIALFGQGIATWAARRARMGR